MALGVVDLQSHVGAPLLQCRESAAYHLWLALQHDIISVGCTRVSGQVFEGGLQHQRKQQVSRRVSLAHACAAQHWRFVRVRPLARLGHTARTH